jgi:uncharacterized protein (TIGR02145 family)
MRCMTLSPLRAWGIGLAVLSGCSDATEPAAEEQPDCALPTVITARVTDIKVNRAVSGGEVTHDGGCGVRARGVVWNTSALPTIGDHKTSDGGGSGSFTSVITELESGASYFVRAYATNDQGTAYGEPRRFRTSQGTVLDIDGNEYEIVKIGALWWMAENLKVTRYSNGDAIPSGLSADEWEKADYGAYTIYPHGLIQGLSSDAEVVAAYGKLYNWFTVDDSRGICPEGWQVPREEDWDQLLLDVGGWPGSFGFPGTGGDALKSTRTDPDSHPRWPWGNLGTNESGWSALPGGRALFDGQFSGLGTHANWLSATARDGLHSWSRFLYHAGGDVFVNYSFKQNGNSIRCIRGAVPPVHEGPEDRRDRGGPKVPT